MSRALAALALLAASACGAPPAEVPARTAVYFSEPYTVDRVYRSMKGPEGLERISLGDPGSPELVWITGYRSQVVAGDRDTPASAEFMCHSNLDFEDPLKHGRLVTGHPMTAHRLFTLSQGQMEVDLPDGFGIPVISTEKLGLRTQILNLVPQSEVFDVRHKTTIEYVLDRELDAPLKPLFQLPLQTFVLVEGRDGYPGMREGGPAHGEGCTVGAPDGAERLWEDPYGRRFAAHWVVPPGRHVYHTPLRMQMDAHLPFDTTAHFIAVHLHPFAESLALRDLTTSTTLFESRARNRRDQIGLELVDSFSSEDGIELKRSHQYELVATYDNTSGEDQDSMAVMFLYVLDRAFRNPVSGPATPRPGRGA